MKGGGSLQRVVPGKRSSVVHVSRTVLHHGDTLCGRRYVIGRNGWGWGSVALSVECVTCLHIFDRAERS